MKTAVTLSQSGGLLGIPSKMTTDIRQVHEENLPQRQRAFLAKLRQHDQKVVVLREYGKLVFHGPVIGDGPMPQDDGGPVEDDTADVRMGGKRWSEIKRRLSNRYAQLTEGDLVYVAGEEGALPGRIERRTMETRVNLDRFLRDECGCAW